MQVTFPELTDLRLSSYYETPPAIPDSFLGGSAPRLRTLRFYDVPFPELPKLLLLATHLVELGLYKIPHSGYMSPEAMATCFSVLSSLKSLYLAFESPHSHPDWESRSLPPQKRSILPALREFQFQGVLKYLEELVILIGAPQLDQMRIDLFN